MLLENISYLLYKKRQQTHTSLLLGIYFPTETVGRKRKYFPICLKASLKTALCKNPVSVSWLKDYLVRKKKSPEQNNIQLKIKFFM